MKNKIDNFFRKQIFYDMSIAGKVILYQAMAVLMICGVLYISNFRIQITRNETVVSPLVQEAN
jgi:hypothetical protein